MSTELLQQAAPSKRAADEEPLRRTLLENDDVLVVATTYPPGASVPIHTHRFPNVSYVIDGGTIETRDADGTVEVYEVQPGETLWSAAAHAHSARNLGSTFVRIVEVELKRASHGEEAPESRAVVLTTDDLDWKTDPLDPRRRSAMLVGDPTMCGAFTSRVAAPGGYIIGLHMHPDEDEQLTVLSGTIRWSTGEPGSGEPEYTLGSGGFALAPAGTPHRIAVLDDAVIQMSGVGPRKYVYLNPADDPRRKR
jgi:quercetin dioxygenase-like cupin family protein